MYQRLLPLMVLAIAACAPTANPATSTSTSPGSPAPGGSAAPSAGPASAAPKAQGGTMTATITANQGANLTATKERFDAALVASTIGVNGTAVTGSNDKASLGLTFLQKSDGSMFAAGDVFGFGTARPTGTALGILQFSDGLDATPRVTKIWAAVGGTMTIDAIAGKAVTFSLKGVSVAPDPTVPNNTATGTFTLDGGGTVESFYGL